MKVALAVILICCVAFLSCDEGQKMLKPAVTPTPPVEAGPADWDTLLASGVVPTEPLKVILNEQQMAQEVLSTFRAPGRGLQDYTVVEIDATAFEKGGILTIDVFVGPAEAAGSFDLFDGTAELPTAGAPDDALASAWDVPPNESGMIRYPFDEGQTFTFGATGNWFSEKGSVNGFLAKISMDPVVDIAAAPDMVTDAGVDSEGENTEENSTEP